VARYLGYPFFVVIIVVVASAFGLTQPLFLRTIAQRQVGWRARTPAQQPRRPPQQQQQQQQPLSPPPPPRAPPRPPDRDLSTILSGNSVIL
jgi:hypothetical protein